MAQRSVLVPGIGEVILSKRRGARNLRLSITAAGQVRVSMPSWTPYSAGAAFARSRSQWIKTHLAEYSVLSLSDGDRVGKSHRLSFEPAASTTKITVNTSRNVIKITYPPDSDQGSIQAKAEKAAERALKTEAEALLPQRVKELAAKYGYSYRSVRTRKLTSRWGSCSQQKDISLSIFLLQLPWKLIDYVILHELTHTDHLNHGRDFWRALETAVPDARQLRKEIRERKPRIEPTA